MAARRILTLALASAAASAHAADASPRSDPTAGRAVFTGVTMPDATSIILDPAALGLGQLDQLYVAVTGLIDQLHIGIEPYNQGGLTAGPVRVRDVEASPGASIAFIYHLVGDQITLGFEARTNPAQSFVDGGRPPLSLLSNGGGERDWLVSFGGSFRVTGDFLFGASVSHQDTFLGLRYARDIALADDTGGMGHQVGDSKTTELYDVDARAPFVSASNLRVNIGLLYQIMHDVWLGVAYHTPPGLGVETELTGHVAIDRSSLNMPPLYPMCSAAAGNCVLHGQSVVDIQFPASVDAELRVRLPRMLDLHVGGRWEDLSRMQSYDVRTFGTTLPAYNIPEWTERPLGMHDGFAGWAGVEQADTGQGLLLGGRLGWERSSLPYNRTSPLTIAPMSFTADVGAQLRVSNAVSLQLSYGLSYFVPVHVTASMFNPADVHTCVASGFDYDNPSCAAVRLGYAIAPGDGNYARIEHAVRIALRYAFP